MLLDNSEHLPGEDGINVRSPRSYQNFGIVVPAGIDPLSGAVRRGQSIRVVTQLDSVASPLPMQVNTQLITFRLAGLNCCLVPQLQPFPRGGFPSGFLLERSDLPLRDSGDLPPPG